MQAKKEDHLAPADREGEKRVEIGAEDQPRASGPQPRSPAATPIRPGRRLPQEHPPGQSREKLA